MTVWNVRNAGRKPSISDKELEEIKAKRAHGDSVTKLAEEYGVSRQTISQIERGDYSPSVTLALKIAKVFDVPVENIFVYEEDE